MLDIEKLKVAELPEIVESIDEIYETQKVLDKVLEKFKQEIKTTKETIETDNYTIKYSYYSQLVPKDLSQILLSYPLEKYPTMYTIKLSKEAGDIIKEMDYLEEKQVESVQFTKHG